MKSRRITVTAVTEGKGGPGLIRYVI
ncbi:hypothetical protein CapIbe_005684, partial [Capra ibex]